MNEFTVQSITDGTEALGEVTVRLAELDEIAASEQVNPQTGLHRNRQFVGHGANTDIIVASATAYINALNRMLAVQDRDRQVEDRETSD